MYARLGSSPSFIWRSIIEAKKFISAGSNWRIGTGKDIQIIGQPLLNIADNPFVSTVSPVLANQVVESLFHPGTKDWDMEVITDCFEERDRSCITNTKVEHERKLWNIKAPPKVLSLVWRAASFCLPTKAILQTKHVQIDNVCPVCKEEVRTIFHSLVQSKVASSCWQILNQRISTDGSFDFADWRSTILSGQSTSLTERIITWKLAQRRCVNVPLRPSKDYGVSGTRLIARNHEGHLILEKTRRYDEVFDPVLAKALSVKEALSWLKEWSRNTVVLESDYLAVVQLICSVTPLRSRLGKVVAECRKLINEINNVRLSFIKQSANIMAHELARVSYVYPDRIFDWSDVPINVKHCILNDLFE
ncbi:uncharacterized protein LOC141691502 [Apium graveolens]|uniref:uncharacterized protein LOC141691502 n=1 Tax=Apium graveolens TaxID=4045 RepID=UPI003D7BE091